MTATLALGVTVGSANAGTFYTSVGAPGVDGEDQAATSIPVGGSEKAGVAAGIWGQTFTVGANDVVFDAFSLQSSQPTIGLRNNTYTFRVGTVSGTAITDIYSESIVQTVDSPIGNWMTWTFSLPVNLSANTTYLATIDMTATDDFTNNIPYYVFSDTSDPYSGGTKIKVNEGSPDTVATAYGVRDMAFHVNLVPVPEPSLALMGLGSLLIGRRRKA